MSHPIDFFYQNAGYVLRPFMKVVEASDEDTCSVCQRPSIQWHTPSEKVVFVAYGNSEVHCTACHSLFQGSIELFGVERLAKGTPVPMKLGMAVGCGALITPGRTILYLNGFIEKMSKADQPPFEMVAMSGKSAHQAVIADPPAVPEYLYIGNFGRRKDKLVSSMQLSTPERLSICEDGQRIDVPLSAMKALIHAGVDLTTTKKNTIRRSLRNLYTGQTRPSELAEEFKAIGAESPELWSAIKGLPQDPHEALRILQLW